MIRLLFFTFVIAAAALPAAAFQTAPRITDKQIIQRLTKLEAGQKAIREEEALRFDAVNRRFDSVNKRIDDLRAEMNNKFDSVDKRFDSVDKRFDSVNKRISDLDRSLNKRIDDLRAEMNDKFDSVNRRIDTIQWMLGVFISIVIVMLGFVLRMQWQLSKRQTSFEVALQSQDKQIQFIKEIINKLLPPKGVL